MEPAQVLAAVLTVMGLPPAPELKAAPVSDILHWAVQHWRPQVVAGIRTVPLPD